jgi:hypothetical protein
MRVTVEYRGKYGIMHDTFKQAHAQIGTGGWLIVTEYADMQANPLVVVRVVSYPAAIVIMVTELPEPVVTQVEQREGESHGR